jgi:hypothetical protein
MSCFCSFFDEAKVYHELAPILVRTIHGYEGLRADFNLWIDGGLKHEVLKVAFQSVEQFLVVDFQSAKCCENHCAIDTL